MREVPLHAVVAAAGASAAGVASVAAPEVGVSDALAKRPMRRDEPMRFVAMTASTAPFRWRRNTYLCMLSQKWGMWPARDVAVRI